MPCKGSTVAGIVTVVRNRPWLSLGISPKPTAPTVASWPLWKTSSVLVDADPGLLQPWPWTVTLVPTGPLFGVTVSAGAPMPPLSMIWGWARSMTIRVGLVNSKTRKPTRWVTPMPAVGQPGGRVEDGGDEQGRGGGDEQPD